MDKKRRTKTIEQHNPIVDFLILILVGILIFKTPLGLRNLKMKQFLPILSFVINRIINSPFIQEILYHML